MTSMYAEISSALVKPTMFYNQILTYAKYDDYERTLGLGPPGWGIGRRFLASLAELISEMWFRVSKY